MKYKTTKKEVMRGFYQVLACGYCELDSLLAYEGPEACVCGVNGWKADIYNVENGIAIVTGYAPFGKQIPYELVKKYEDQARKFLNSRNNKNPRPKLRRMLEKMIEEINNKENKK